MKRLRMACCVYFLFLNIKEIRIKTRMDTLKVQ